MADQEELELLARELAALPDRERALVLQRLRELGVQAQALANRMTGSTHWGNLVGGTLYDSYGNGVAVVDSVTMDTAGEPDEWWLERSGGPLPVRRMRIVVTAYGIQHPNDGLRGGKQ